MHLPFEDDPLIFTSGPPSVNQQSRTTRYTKHMLTVFATCACIFGLVAAFLWLSVGFASNDIRKDRQTTCYLKNVTMDTGKCCQWNNVWRQTLCYSCYECVASYAYNDTANVEHTFMYQSGWSYTDNNNATKLQIESTNRTTCFYHEHDYSDVVFELPHVTGELVAAIIFSVFTGICVVGTIVVTIVRCRLDTAS